MDDEAPEADSRYLKLPWQLVAGALFAVLAAALGVGLIASRNLREQLALPPTPTGLPAVVSTATVPVAAATVVASATSVPTVLATPTSGVPTVAVSAATVTRGPAALATASPVPTVDPALATEVGRAYETYWRVRAQAVLLLDSTHLSEVMDGDHLIQVEQRINELRTEGRAIKTKVALNYSIVEADPASASVVDRIDDDSYYVKAGTEVPLTQPAADVLRVLFRLRKSSGVWKVVDSVGAN